MDEISAAVIHVFSLLQSEMTFQGLDTFSKGGFFSESAICYSSLQKNIPNNYLELEI